ncbi:transposase [Massilia sp. P8910]|uniref:transposase n=1 Tax=Massilia antarctica TaxID=2765360 RepID=UPI0006BB6EFC|nr:MULTISPECIES: transposase [Massilia]MCE3603312.1 transposase [Massilia antarctica]MCY0913424.1 transposase [Massilia sp. H27-R4]
MPRRHRLIVPDVPIHIIQRGNNRLPCFFVEADYLVYLDLLRIAAEQAGCSVHAYVLMTNHIHLLVSPQSSSSPAAMMKSLGERYVQYVNRRHQRIGTLWQGRYRSCLVQEDHYFFVCQRYIELNPVRAGMVAHPLDYRWSSYQANAYGEASRIVTPHALYSALAAEHAERELSYRALFLEKMPWAMVEQVRDATNRNAVLGNEEFIARMARASGEDVMPRRQGRHRD